MFLFVKSLEFLLCKILNNIIKAHYYTIEVNDRFGIALTISIHFVKGSYSNVASNIKRNLSDQFVF